MESNPQSFIIQAWSQAKLFILPLLLFSFIAKLLYNKVHSPSLRRIPGPWLAAYTKYWRLYSVYRGHAHKDIIDLHRRYGPVVRTAPDIVDIADAAAIPLIYTLNERFTKTAFYPIQSISWRKQPAMNIFSTRLPAEHRHMKKQVANSFSMSQLLLAEPAVDSCTTLFTSRLTSLSHRPLDLGAWLQYYAFDVVGELTFAKKFGFLQQGRDVDGMMAAIEGMLAYAALVGQVPEWHARLLGNPVFTRFAPAMETWNAVVLFTLKAINARTAFSRDGEMVDAEEKGYDMLSKFRAVKASDPLKMDTGSIVVHTSGNVFAGSDTTAIALRAVIYYICRNPDKKAKMLAELNDADRKGLLSSPVSYKESSTHLPYFDAVLKEAMRLHPSVGLLMERHCPPEGATFCGYNLPGGTIVGINPWALNYDPKNFADPERFVPERWLEPESEVAEDREFVAETEGELKARENMLMFNFGGGARTCQGKHISLMEMHKVLPELFRRFEVELAEPEKEWKITNHWFVQQEGLVCRLTPRGK